MLIVCSNYDLYSAQHMDLLWFEDKSGYGVAWHKNADKFNRREHVCTNRALNHIDKLGLAELALAEVTFWMYHDVSVGRWSPSGKREGCGVWDKAQSGLTSVNFSKMARSV